MSDTFTFTVNAESVTVTTDPERPLLDVLREDLRLTGTKYGCGEGECRACTVLVDGRPLPSCRTPIHKADGKSIVTIEGISEGETLHRVQAAFLAEGAFQCGYCTPGMILTAVALLRAEPEPSDDQIVAWMNGNICRCCGYPKILAAVRRASGYVAEGAAQ